MVLQKGLFGSIGQPFCLPPDATEQPKRFGALRFGRSTSRPPAACLILICMGHKALFIHEKRALKRNDFLMILVKTFC